MAVTGLNRPDFHTIADFRKRRLAALSDLFVQVLQLCRAAGLVQFGHVAVDGTKLKANASRHKAMSYGRMKTTEPALAAEVDARLTQAHEADAAEDREHGADQRGDGGGSSDPREFYIRVIEGRMPRTAISADRPGWRVHEAVRPGFSSSGRRPRPSRPLS
jgi:hypothetical protein